MMIINKTGILPEIVSLDMEMIKTKLMDEEEGLGWNAEACKVAEYQYKRFLTLNKIYPQKAIVPDKVIDTVWHYHILDTRKYHKDSEVVFGRYFHHYPYFGMRGESDKKELELAFEQTKLLFVEHFGVELALESAKCDSGSCSSCRNCVSTCQGH